MPGFDKTGPNGVGPLTGRGLGPCGKGLVFRKGFNRGSGFGRGFRFRRFVFAQPTITETEEKQLLQQELTDLEEETKEIEARLKELSKNKEK